MSRILLTMTLLGLAASPASGMLGIEKIEACYGKLGPVRKSLDYYPHEDVFIRFVATGAKAEESKVHLLCSYVLSDAQGKEVKSASNPFMGSNAFGSDAVPCCVPVGIPDNSPPGEYSLKVRVRDFVSGEEVGFERKLRLKPTEFAIVSPRFFYDSQFTVDAPPGGVVGQYLHCFVATIGFDRTAAKVVNNFTVEIFDKDKKLISTPPARYSVGEENDKAVREAPTLRFATWIALTKPGDYILRITAIDPNSQKTATFESTLRVTAP